MLSLLPRSTLFPYTTLFRSQFYVIVLVAKLVFPYLNLPDLELSFSKLLLMSVMTLSAGFTAISLGILDRKSTRLNSSHVRISYAVFCLKKKKKIFFYYLIKY